VCLFGSLGLLHVKTLPVSGTTIKNMDLARLDNYLRDILKDPEIPADAQEWSERLLGPGFLKTDTMGQEVCTIAGMVLFGINPRRYLPQAGLRVMAFSVAEKQYQAILDFESYAFHWPTKGPNDSSIFPSMLMETNPELHLPRIHISFWEGLLPPGRGTLHSGKIKRGSMPDSLELCFRTESTSGGNQFAFFKNGRWHGQNILMTMLFLIHSRGAV